MLIIECVDAVQKEIEWLKCVQELSCKVCLVFCCRSSCNLHPIHCISFTGTDDVISCSSLKWSLSCALVTTSLAWCNSPSVGCRVSRLYYTSSFCDLIMRLLTLQFCMSNSEHESLAPLQGYRTTLWRVQCSCSVLHHIPFRVVVNFHWFWNSILSRTTRTRPELSLPTYLQNAVNRIRYFFL